MAASITKKEMQVALREILPPFDPEIITFGMVLERLAARFSVDQDELKKARKAELKLMIADMIYLCEGGENKENEGGSNQNASDDEEEEEEEPVVRKKKSVAKRSRAIRDSDEEDGDDGESSLDGEDSEAGDDDDSEDKKPTRRKKAPIKKQKTTAKPSATKRKAPAATKAVDQPKDSEGIASLKELARVAGLMGPVVYSMLKKAGSEEDQEAILRERLSEGGVRFSGAYPKKSDITAAKRKKDKERELDGIDTSLIITGGRPRRGAAQPASYVEKYEDEEEDEELEKGEGQHENGHDEHQEESEAHVESDVSDDSEAEF